MKTAGFRKLSSTFTKKKKETFMMNVKVKHGKFSKKKISFTGFFMEILKKKYVSEYFSAFFSLSFIFGETFANL